MKKLTEISWAQFDKAQKDLKDFEENHPKLLVILRALVEEYNKAIVNMDHALRSEVSGRSETGPFSTHARTVTKIDLDTLILKAPKVLLEPGVVSRVNPGNTIAACERTKLKRLVGEIATKSTGLAISKPDKLNLEW